MARSLGFAVISLDLASVAIWPSGGRFRSALTFSFEGTNYCVDTRGPGTAMRGGKAMVHRLNDGRPHVIYKEWVLALTACGTYQVPDTAADEKTPDARVGRRFHTTEKGQ